MGFIIKRTNGATRTVEPRPGRTLAQEIFAHGFLPPRPLCSGLGRCGLCRVRFEDASLAPAAEPSEQELLAPEEIADGWRLACRRQAQAVPDGAVIFAPDIEQDGRRMHADATPDAKPSATRGAAGEGPVGLCLAVDLGTTSLHWAAMQNEICVAHGVELNPQLGAGSEVMSRIGYALDPDGARELQALVVDRLEALADSLPAMLDADVRVEQVCLVGNTAMTAIAQGRSVDGLARAPYRLEYPGDAESPLSERLPRCYVPAQIGPFVGADAAAGLVPLLRQDIPRPFLLADLGTNGEFILVMEQGGEVRLHAASVALGPALEGIGLGHGAMAGPGVATRFELAPAGLVAKEAGGAMLRTAAGISGTGYLSLVHTLIRAGALDRDGHFLDPDEVSSPLARRLLASVEEHAAHRALRLPLVQENGQPLHLDPRDVEELLKVKAAFHVAFDVLLAAAGITAGDLDSVQLAGALGEHVSPADLEGLGFVPRGIAPRLRAAGNLALEGAKLLCYETSLRTRLAQLARRAQVLDLASDGGFHAAFAAAMTFDHATHS
ncbi:ASKHA domain-containing protein [Oceanidesulfovibrio marinus]|uniref:DUF4445 domain-containing protein n=1 Tax=Oceanidesulfovibrio marinus TaxID=370038 RepID=A0ABX6NJQ4_9BACT|nr:ASKHA domain-containing protein [Oceanidesulfovibrio marinus]QJT10877.1 DUF4445 domain-containing protein [Oceanidesulfovibrio marinus]